MQVYYDLLKDEFKDKQSFYRTIYTAHNNKIKPSKLIVELNKLGYDFTQSDFDNFIICATYKKGNSYIICKSGDYYDKENDWGNAIKIMFTKFSPSSKQFNILISCHKYQHAPKDWIDTLVNRNYAFTEGQKKQLIDIGYDVTNFYKNVAILTVDEIKTMINSIIIGTSNMDIMLKIMKMDIQYPEDFIDSILMIYKDIPNKIHQHYLNLWRILEFYTTDKKLKINDSINDVLVDNKFGWNIIYYFMFKTFNITDKLIEFCASRIEYKILILMMHKQNNIELNTNLMNKMIKVPPVQIMYYTTVYEKLVEFGYKDYINSKALDLTDFMIQYAIVPNEETFKIACENNYENLFDYCTSKYKMLPTSEHLKFALKQSFSPLINRILCYKIIPDKEHFKLAIKRGKDIMELLIKFGYVMDRDDVENSLIHEHCVDNLDRFGIKLDEEVYYWSHIYYCWYYKNQFELKDKNTLGLRLLCLDNKTTPEVFDKYVKDNNIEPDGYCLEHACRYNQSLAVHLLKTLKYKPTVTVFYWLQTSTAFNTVYYKMLDQYGVNDAYLSLKLQK